MTNNQHAANENKPTVLLTGGTGFIGKGTREAIHKEQTHNIRVLTQNTNGFSRDETVQGDLTDLPSLRRATVGVTALIHSASYIGYDPELCHQINVEGTKKLITSAQENDVKTIIYMSTSAVYGSGPYRGIQENEFPPMPVSVLSNSRLEAEKIVLAAGGTVIRPNIVYGQGDQRALPLFLQTTTTLDAYIDNGDSQLSMIRVDHLGLLTANLLKHPPHELHGLTFHANDLKPIRVSEILTQCAQKLGFTLPKRSITLHEALKNAAALRLTQHQLALMATDHWYDSSKIRNLTKISYPEGFHLDDAAIRWYTQLLPQIQQKST
jgi:nucleoside-diphosphate-sugar epimerase